MKRSLRFACSLLGALALSIALASCSLLSGDEAVVHDMVDNTMKIFKSTEGDDIASFADQSFVDTLNSYGVDADEFFSHCFKHLSWEIGDIKLSGDTGTVSLTITNADLNSAFELAGDRFDAYAETDEAQQLFDEDGESALVTRLFDFFYEIMDADEVETATSEVTLGVFKNEDGSWEIDPDNEAFFKALYGGAELSL